MGNKTFAHEMMPARAAQTGSLRTPVLMFVITGLGVFAAETGLMLILALFHERLNTWQQAMVDALLLILLLCPLMYLVYVFTFRPMRLHNAELTRLGKELQHQIVQGREVEAALRNSERQLHLLSAQLLMVQERERQLVARELHEDLGQCLVVLKLRLRELENAVGDDHSACRTELQSARQQIDDMVGHIRRLSRELSPAMLQDLGFTTAARQLVLRYARDAGIKATVQIDSGVDVLLQGAEGIHTYRILEEALENVRKHAGASCVSVSMRRGEHALTLAIEDDGEGLDCRPDLDRGLGLATMSERARMLNSSLDLWGEQGRGTRITLDIPLPQGSTRNAADAQAGPNPQ